MKIKGFIILSLVFLLSLFTFKSVFAESKMSGIGPGSVIPKLPKTANDPRLSNGHVYPFWGPPCQRYTYSVIYQDDKGRPPEYIRIYFNGKMIDMDKADPTDNNYQTGVRYIFKYVPNRVSGNFYYFEASNGLGKARDSIIDSPDNGPVLFESAFDKNEIGLIDASSGKKIWSFNSGKEWVDGVALSDNGQYLAAKTSKHVYLFKTESPNPVWQFNCEDCFVGGDVKGGVAISGDGSKVVAAIGENVILFDQSTNKPLWKRQTGNAYNIAISQDGNYVAAATAGEESNLNSNLLIVWNQKNSQPLWQFHSSGNFHDVSLSADGKYIAGATGCPDRQAYIFSRDSNNPIMVSGRLTYDSPVSKSKITADGNFAAFSTEGGPQSAVLLLYSKDSKNPLWKFEDNEKRAARGLEITPDGKFIGVATMGGDIYLFGKNSRTPIKNWRINASTGVLDIADNGSFLVTGGTDNKLHLLYQDGQLEKQIPFNQYLGSVDISANGKYIAAGTSGAIYFFESYADENKIFDCTKITEPEAEEKAMAGFNRQENRPDNSVKLPSDRKGVASILTEGLLLVTALGIVYGLFYRFADKFALTWPLLVLITLPMAIALWSMNGFQFNFKTIIDFCASAFSLWSILLLVSLVKKVPKPFYIIGAVYLAVLGIITLTAYEITFSFPTLVHLLEAVFGFGYLLSLLKKEKRLISSGIVILVLLLAHLIFQLKTSGVKNKSVNQNNLQTPASAEKASCGNNMCEPDFGETKQNCPKDCSGRD